MKKSNLTLLRYPGGKFYALKLLEPFWKQSEHDEYREPFFGGGSVFWAKEKSKINWINDLEPELINLLECIKDENKRKQLLNMFEKEMEATKEKHTFVKNMVPNNDIERAYKYFYLNRTSFSGKMKSPSWGYRPKRSVPPYRWKEKIIPASAKLENIKITNTDFAEVIQAPAKGEKVLIFLDPPYFKAKQESHYIKSFKLEDHIRLAEILKKTTHNFFLTYDDCQEIRNFYSWANIYETSFFYRLDNSQNNGKTRKIGNELIICNYKLEVQND